MHSNTLVRDTYMEGRARCWMTKCLLEQTERTNPCLETLVGISACKGLELKRDKQLALQQKLGPTQTKQSPDEASPMYHILCNGLHPPRNSKSHASFHTEYAPL